MFERFLGIADLHLTAEVANEYRWKIFDHVKALVSEKKLTDVLLCGDISDFKDGHSADYVNKLINALADLGKLVRVHWVMGNHDMVKADTPFFEFIKHIDGLYYYKEPTFYDDENILLLPYTKGAANEWKDLDLSGIELIFMHQPCIGSKSSDFYTLESGLDPQYFTKEHAVFKGQVFSGDIHVPQTVRDVTYFGAPHLLRYGDKYETGGFIYTAKPAGDYEVERVDFPSPRKWHIHIDKPDDLTSYEAKVNQCPDFKDWVRVTVNFSGEGYEKWSEWRAEITRICTDVLDVIIGPIALGTKAVDFEAIERVEETADKIDTTSPVTVLQAYAKREELDRHLIKLGTTIINDCNNN